jgi:hypothetical protein
MNKILINNTQTRNLFLILFVVYFITIIPVLSLTILLIGKADLTLVIFYGIINAIFVKYIFKNNFFFNILLGFFISSVSLCLVYLFVFILKNFELIAKINIGIHLFFFFSFLFFIFIIINLEKLKHQEIILLFCSFTSLFFVPFSSQLKELNPYKTHQNNLILVNLKLIDKYQKPKVSATIEVRLLVYPLFGLRETHDIEKIITDKNGNAKIELSKVNDYELTINANNYFEINAKDLKTKESFIIDVD